MSILSDHFDDPYHRGECECPTHAGVGSIADVASSEPKLGSQQEVGPGVEQCECQIQFELAIDDNGQIVEAWWDGQGCSLCEGAASVLAEFAENRLATELPAETLSSVLRDASGIGEPTDFRLCPCQGLVIDVLQRTLQSPLNELDDDLADGTQFGGPSLREEC